MAPTPPLGYWNAHPIAAITNNFWITYDDRDDSSQKLTLDPALDLAATCESDLAWLEGVFQCNFHGGKYGTVVIVENGQNAASNGGWNPSGSSGMTINAAFMAPMAPNVRAEMVRMLFVAELAEILMDFTPYGWGRGDSYGEALSVVTATLRHPTGYYGSGAGPRVNDWLATQFPRVDWISKKEPTDDDQISYGCGIVFIYYLVSQLGFSLKQVVAAGGSSGADTFAHLTGRPGNQAINELRALLVSHLPAGSGATVRRDNFFPLLAPGSRSVHVDWSPRDPNPSDIPDSTALHVRLSAGILCKERDYSYVQHNLVFQIDAITWLKGFGAPEIAWSLGGIDLAPSSGWTDVVVPVTITDTTPKLLEVPTTENLPIRYRISSGFNTSTLSIQNKTSPGNGNVPIAVNARETWVPADTGTAAVTNCEFSTRSYDMDADYQADLGRCQPHQIRRLADEVAEIAREVFILRNTPDPPDGGQRLGHLSSRRDQLLKELTGGNIGLRRSVTELATSLVSEPLGSFQQAVQVPPASAEGRPKVVTTDIPELIHQSDRDGATSSESIPRRPSNSTTRSRRGS